MSGERITVRNVDTAAVAALRAYVERQDLTLGQCVTEAIQAWLAARLQEPTAEEQIEAIVHGLSRQSRLLQEFQRALCRGAGSAEAPPAEQVTA